MRKNLRFTLGTAGRRKFHHLRWTSVDQQKSVFVNGQIAHQTEIYFRYRIETTLNIFANITAARVRTRVILQNVFIVLWVMIVFIIFSLYFHFTQHQILTTFCNKTMMVSKRSAWICWPGFFFDVRRPSCNNLCCVKSRF